MRLRVHKNTCRKTLITALFIIAEAGDSPHGHLQDGVSGVRPLDRRCSPGTGAQLLGNNVEESQKHAALTFMTTRLQFTH